MGNASALTSKIKSKAYEQGFEFVGISRAEKLLSQEEKLRSWLNKGYQGKMSYLENHFDKRLDPTELLSGTKSIISLMYNHYPENQQEADGFKIAKYAYGRDYHKVVKKKMKHLAKEIMQFLPEANMRSFVDSAPVMERQWAQKSGLGWIGKNGLLINKERGSYFFLAELMIDIELEYDSAIPDYCGTCTRCLDACPTDAFPEPYVLDASKCISYATIELKDENLPDFFKDKMQDWIFGCDICQDVCPWNRFSQKHEEEEFSPRESILKNQKEDWIQLNEEEFEETFKGSAVKRTGYKGLMRNINFTKESKSS